MRIKLFFFSLMLTSASLNFACCKEVIEPDSIPHPKVLFLYKGDFIDAQTLLSLAPKQMQIIPLEIQAVIPMKISDSVAGISVKILAITVMFAKNKDAAPYSISEYKNPTSQILVQWSFSGNAKPGNVILFLIRYSYVVKDSILQEGTMSEYFQF